MRVVSEFYRKGSDSLYFGSPWGGERNVLEAVGAELLKVADANQLALETLLSPNRNFVKPQLSDDYHYLAFPYELDDEASIASRTLADEIISLINCMLGSPIYLASTDPEKCCVVRLKHFILDVFWAISSGHLNTPFAVFDEHKSFYMILDYDLPIQVVGYRPGMLKQEFVQKWTKYFQRHWPIVEQKYCHYPGLKGIVDEQYSFVKVMLASDQI